MDTLSASRHALRLGCALALLAGASYCIAQSASQTVRAVPQPAAPATAPGAVGFGVPQPAGLPSPIPNPAGLNSRFSAGLPSPVPHPEGLPSPNFPNLASPRTPAGRPPIDAGAAPPTNEMGGVAYGGSGYGGATAAQQSPGTTSGPYTALQIAQSFIGADGNRDGELTRGEARRLTIMPYSFEEMDLNHDGILTRFEYEDGVR
jgi:hypothetical protein